MDVTFAFNNGDQVEDTLTGFKGIVFGLAIYKNGCKKVGIMPKGLHDGKAVSMDWFDEQDVELISAGEQRDVESSGGPAPSPPGR